MASLMRFFVCVSGLFALLGRAATATLLNANEIPFSQQTYAFDPENLCRLLAHESIVLKNDQHDFIVLDGGFGKFKHGSDIEVVDMNRYTAAFDLDKGFETSNQGPEFIYQHGKSLQQDGGAPVLTQFGPWSDGSQDSIYIHGGNFFNDTPWTESAYHVPKSQIPGNSLWRLNLSTSEWADITPEDMAGMNRTFAGAACSVPGADMSFWLGGITNAFTSATTPDNSVFASNQFLIYDHKEGAARHEVVYEQSSNRYLHGSLDHLDIGSGHGFLISLMSQQAPASVPQGDEEGQDVSFKDIMLYDVDQDFWINQSAAVLEGEAPPSVTRFCSVIVHEEGSKSWELWLFGGQDLTGSRSTTESAVWVLIMPAFMWTRVPLVPEHNNSNTRSHTCHAVGSQLLIVGGYPLVEEVDREAPCEKEFVKVLELSDVGWKGRYEKGTKYRTPEVIALRRKSSPVTGSFVHECLAAAFDHSMKGQSSLTGSAIAGIVVGSLAGLVILCVGMWFLCKKHQKDS